MKSQFAQFVQIPHSRNPLSRVIGHRMTSQVLQTMYHFNKEIYKRARWAHARHGAALYGATALDSRQLVIFATNL